jgi:two-component system sensor histidine kinase RegB
MELAQLTLLRWGVLAVQVLVIVVASAGGVVLPLRALAPVLLLVAASNVIAVRRARRPPVPRAWSGGLMAFDTLALTAILYLTGGAHNPFSVLYLVSIAMGALVLGPRWTAGLAAPARAGSAAGLGRSRPRDDLRGHDLHGAYALHLRGMWIAFGLAALLVAYFGERLARALASREAEVLRLAAESARQARLASLGTLAAGAAHELATPLATIGVAAREIERAAAGRPGLEGAAEDAALIASELRRCRAILDEMAAQAGTAAGEAACAVAFDALARDVVARVKSPERVAVEGASEGDVLRVPRQAVARALANLVQNAIDASPEGARVSLAARRENGHVVFVVEDRGSGMAPEVLARAGEPFFTTKPPGAGMGLGVFLARTLAEGAGGRLRLESQPGRGTRACLEIPGLRG